MIAINLDHIAVNFAGRQILTSLDWEIHDDRCAGLVGPNGCGKSTLLKIIAGELRRCGNVFRAKTDGRLPAARRHARPNGQCGRGAHRLGTLHN
jgi:ATPase subunit of ABC transporter with duplicated ATPase domains